MTESERVFPDPEALSAGAAELVHRCATDAVARRGRFSMVLAGGNTPRALYQVLARDYVERIDWSRTQVFFGDERCVPPDHKDSNYAMARETLLSRVPVPAGNVHQMDGRLGAAHGAEDYERVLRNFFRAAPTATFDMVLLGMGADGHTLSLFPGHDFQADSGRWVVPALAPAGAPGPERITLTLDAVAGAGHAAFLVAGKDKSAALREVRRATQLGDGPPAARVKCKGELVWYLDHAAAATEVPGRTQTGPLPSG